MLGGVNFLLEIFPPSVKVKARVRVKVGARVGAKLGVWSRGSELGFARSSFKVPLLFIVK